MRRAFSRFQQAQTPLEEYSALQLLLDGNFPGGLGEEYTSSEAGPGSYMLKMTERCVPTRSARGVDEE
ncbi:MAG: hypothetical protein GTN78_00660 [Gemmatimonadales bacterium]|nr:hypothetical protein [Gemmatimonadales bacterium]NIN10050.1 hypothetical protein [Gemmatimonadales bacterium]NIQ98703.1 hypothetical protein [Gemmatimonadales bacterium]NIS63579.1 hypothetical protein [Gemmatimonadales bacterium]